MGTIVAPARLRAHGSAVPEPPGTYRKSPDRPGRASRSGAGAEPRVARGDDGLRPGFRPELSENGRNVVAHRLLAEAEVRGDLVVVEATRQVFEELALARGELRKSGMPARGQEFVHLREEPLPGGFAFEQDVVAAL